MKKKSFILLISLVFVWGNISAQNVLNSILQGITQGANNYAQQVQRNNKYDRSSIRNAINGWNECKCGCLTLEHGAVAFYGTNGYYYTANVPDALKTSIANANKTGQTLDYVCIDKNGDWCLVYNNGINWTGVFPEGNSVLSVLNSISGETFRSISFNTAGEYAIVTDRDFYSSNSLFKQYYESLKSSMGELYSVTYNTDGLILNFACGTKYLGNIPSKVIQAVDAFKTYPHFVAFTDNGDYLLTSSTGYYSYSITDPDQSSYNAKTFYAAPGAQSSSDTYIATSPVYTAPTYTSPVTTTTTGVSTAEKTARLNNALRHEDAAAKSYTRDPTPSSYRALKSAQKYTKSVSH